MRRTAYGRIFFALFAQALALTATGSTIETLLVSGLVGMTLVVQLLALWLLEPRRAAAVGGCSAWARTPSPSLRCW